MADNLKVPSNISGAVDLYGRTTLVETATDRVAAATPAAANTEVATPEAPSAQAGVQLGLAVEPKALTLVAPVSASGTARPWEITAKLKLGVTDVLVPFAFGTMLPPAADLVRGQNLSGMSLSNVAANWTHPIVDKKWLAKENLVQHLGMHGWAGSEGYLYMRNQGFGPLMSSIGSLSVGVGIDFGQSLRPNHRADVTDQVGTMIVGALEGEARYQAYLWARAKYDETGNRIYNAIGLIANAQNVFILPDGNGGVRVGFRIKW